MNSQTAIQGEIGGAVVFLHIPTQLLLNVDLTTWRAPEDAADCFVVTGIKPGSHFVGWRNEALGSNEGLVVWLSPRQVAVFEWVERLEVLLPVRDEAELFRYQRGYDNLSLLHVQKPFLDSLQENLLSLGTAPVEAVDIDDFAKKPSDAQVGTDKVEDSQYPLTWTDLPPLQKTLDTSETLSNWIKLCEARFSDSSSTPFNHQLLKSISRQLRLSTGETICLGELQLAFVHFVLGSNLSAFQHWKSYYRIMPLANAIYDDNSNLGYHWLRTLLQQICQLPPDFHQSDITQNNFIVAATLDTLDYTLDHMNPIISNGANLLKVDTFLKLYLFLQAKLEKIVGMSWVEISQLQSDRFTVVE